MAREIGNIFVLPIEMFKDIGYFSFLMWVNCEVWSSVMIFLQEMYILVPTWEWDPSVQQRETLPASVPPRRAALSQSKPDQLLSIIPGKFRPKFTGFPGGSAGRGSSCNAGGLGSTPRLGRFLKKGTATHSSILAWIIPWTAYFNMTSHFCLDLALDAFRWPKFYEMTCIKNS